jgi:hypothetical protein
MQLNDYDAPTNASPDFFEVLRAAQDSGLIGEEDTLLTVVLGMLRGQLIVMTGPSRGGKDEVVDAAESVFDAENLVYRWPVDDSETAAFYRADTINRYPVQRFPDLARLQEHHEKILKAFGEGRDAERTKTDITAAEDGDQVDDQVLTCPHTVLAFIASDNQNVDLNDYPELRNRALILSVDASEEQTERVNERKARERAGQIERNVDPIRLAQIQDYHGSVPVDEWTDSPGNEIINPAAIEIHEQEPIPQKFPEARQDFDRLLEFMETVGLYHYVDRLVVDMDNAGRRLLATPTDIWEAMTILGNKMVMSALNLREEDLAVLNLLDDASSNLTKADIQQSLRHRGYNIEDKQVEHSLKSMRGKGYVRMFQDAVNEYTLSEFASVVRHDVGLDYDNIVDAAATEVYEVLPDDAADVYVSEFCEGDGLITTHPFTGEAVDITQTNELESMLEDNMEEAKEVIEDTSQETQGTIT